MDERKTYVAESDQHIYNRQFSLFEHYKIRKPEPIGHRKIKIPGPSYFRLFIRYNPVRQSFKQKKIKWNRE